jgi:hypothetical protein
MSKIILAPYPAKLHTGKRNPKEYPWWDKVVRKLNERGHEVIQIGVQGEARVKGVAQFIVNWPLAKLKDLINDADTWLSCDSFLPHYCHVEGLKGGVVVWSLSDPAHWGHPENTNILKDRKYLRELQYQDWNSCDYNEAAFVLPEVVVNAVIAKLNAPGAVTEGRCRVTQARLQLEGVSSAQPNVL